MKRRKRRTTKKGDDFEKVKSLCEIRKNRKQLCARRIHFCSCGKWHGGVINPFKSVFHCARRRDYSKPDSKVSELDLAKVAHSVELVH